MNWLMEATERKRKALLLKEMDGSAEGSVHSPGGTHSGGSAAVMSVDDKRQLELSHHQYSRGRTEIGL
jgi:hypothetical protein